MFNIHERHLKQDPVTATLVLAGVGTAVNIQQQRKATKADKRSLAAQQRIADIRATRARTKAVREARIRRAEVVSGAQAVGAGDTSAAAGAAGSIQTQLGANLSFLDRVQNLSTQASIFGQEAASARGRAATARAVAGVSQSIFQVKGGFDELFKD